MTCLSKLLPALIIGTLVLLTGNASARPKRARPKPPAAVEAVQTAPAALPRQLFPEKGIQPLTPEIEQALKPKDGFKECDVFPEMVVVPKGSFMMGGYSFRVARTLNVQ